eukprot:scaffold21184_cov127-Cylindrotheca_fusiformis.AAC.2
MEFAMMADLHYDDLSQVGRPNKTQHSILCFGAVIERFCSILMREHRVHPAILSCNRLFFLERSLRKAILLPFSLSHNGFPFCLGLGITRFFAPLPVPPGAQSTSLSSAHGLCPVACPFLADTARTSGWCVRAKAVVFKKAIRS